MSYLAAIIVMVIIIVAIAIIFWGIPMITREKPGNGGSLVVSPPPPPGSAGGGNAPGTSKLAFITATAPLPIGQDFGPDSTAPSAAGTKEGHGGWRHHLHASPNLQWWGPDGQLTQAHEASRQGHRDFIAATAPLPIGQDFGPDSTAPDNGTKEGHGGWQHHHDASPNLEWYGWHDRFRKEGHGGWRHHHHADPTLEWWGPDGQLTRARQAAHEHFSGSKKERYGEPPGMIRGIHQDELGFRGWADMPGDYEGSSASSLSAYMQRSA